MNVDIMRACVEFVKNGETKYLHPENGFQTAVWIQDDWSLSREELDQEIKFAKLELSNHGREKLDKERLRTIDALLAVDPECGTAFCVAGLATQLHGNVPNEVDGWTSAGARALDIKMSEANALFDADNTREQVFAVVRKICARHGVNPAEVGL